MSCAPTVLTALYLGLAGVTFVAALLVALWGPTTLGRWWAWTTAIWAASAFACAWPR